MNSPMKQIFQYALKLEQDGIDFYSASKKKAGTSLGRQMFDFLIGEEKKHVKVITRMIKDKKTGSDVKALSVRRRDLKTVFAGIIQKYGKEINANPDEIKALEMARELENKGYGYYKSEAEKSAPASAEKALLEELAAQESLHYELIEKTLDFYRDPSNWYLTEEGGPVEGG